VLHKDTNLNDIKETVEIMPDIKVPITKGDVLGKVTYTLNDSILGSIDLVAQKSVAEKKISKIIRNIKNPRKYTIVKVLIVLTLAYIIWRSIVTAKRLKRRRRYY